MHCIKAVIKNGAFLALTLATPSLSQAVQGKLSTQGGPDATCRLTSADLPDYSCSGARTKDGPVVTSAHCLTPFAETKAKLRLNCGPSAKSYEVTRIMVNSAFKEPTVADRIAGRDDWSGGLDVGTVSIEIPKDDIAKDLPVTLSFEELGRKLFNGRSLKSGVECRMSGFGYDSDFNLGRLNSAAVTGATGQIKPMEVGTDGRLHVDLRRDLESAELAREWFSIRGDDFEDFKLKNAAFLLRHDLADVLMAAGDSGGPLLCREGAGQEWVLLGVNHSATFDSSESMAKVPPGMKSLFPNGDVRPGHERDAITLTLLFWTPVDLSQVDRVVSEAPKKGK